MQKHKSFRLLYSDAFFVTLTVVLFQPIFDFPYNLILLYAIKIILKNSWVPIIYQNYIWEGILLNNDVFSDFLF